MFAWLATSLVLALVATVVDSEAFLEISEFNSSAKGLRRIRKEAKYV